MVKKKCLRNVWLSVNIDSIMYKVIGSDNIVI